MFWIVPNAALYYMVDDTGKAEAYKNQNKYDDEDLPPLNIEIFLILAAQLREIIFSVFCIFSSLRLSCFNYLLFQNARIFYFLLGRLRMSHHLFRVAKAGFVF